MIIAILGVHGDGSLEGDGVVVFVRLASEHHVVKITVQRVHAEVHGNRSFLNRTEEQFRLANGHGI